jgi:hypothetical protein
VGIVPTLLADPSPGQSVREVLAMVGGIGAMVAIALTEHH